MAGLATGALLTGCSGNGPPAAGPLTPAQASSSSPVASPTPDADPASATPATTPKSGAGSGTTAGPLVPAGTDVAHLVSSLPAGPAGGHVRVDLDGLGELTGSFTGTCLRRGGDTDVVGTSDTAAIRLTFTPGSSTLDFHDTGGVSSHSELARGDYRVSGRVLDVGTQLIGDGGRIGTIQLHVTCGG
jgi:hypothetical protein